VGVALHALRHDNLVPRNLDKKLELRRSLNLFCRRPKMARRMTFFLNTIAAPPAGE
jgi:hypothetical protein